MLQKEKEKEKDKRSLVSVTNSQKRSNSNTSQNVSVTVQVERSQSKNLRPLEQKSKRVTKDSDDEDPPVVKKKSIKINNRTLVFDVPAPFDHPMPYSFHRYSCKPSSNSMASVSVKFPPGHVLFDHTVAVLWIFASARSTHDIFTSLGIVHIQWTLHYLRSLKNSNGEYPVDIINLIDTFEDFLIMMYASLAPLVDDALSDAGSDFEECGDECQDNSSAKDKKHSEGTDGDKQSDGAFKGNDGAADGTGQPPTFTSSRADNTENADNSKKKKKCAFKCVPKKKNDNEPYRKPIVQNPEPAANADANSVKSMDSKTNNINRSKKSNARPSAPPYMNSNQSGLVGTQGKRSIYQWNDAHCPKSLTYNQLMSKYGDMLGNQPLPPVTSSRGKDKTSTGDADKHGKGLGSLPDVPEEIVLDCPHCLICEVCRTANSGRANHLHCNECSQSCMYSRKVIENFLVNWQQEQRTKIDTELQRLRTIEKYINAMNTTAPTTTPANPPPTPQQDSSYHDFKPTATSSPERRNSFSENK